MARARVWVLLAAVLAGQAASYLPRLTNQYQFNQFNRDDTESFLSLGHSLAHGRGYTTSLDPDAYAGHTHFPPGFPLLMAVGFLVGDRLWPTQLPAIAFALGNSILFWSLARRYLPPMPAFLALVLVVCSPVYDQLATVAMSEQATLFFLLLGIWSFLEWSAGGYRLDRRAALVSGAIGYGLLVRGQMLPLLPAMWLHAWFDDRGKAAIEGRMRRVTAALALGTLPWIAWEVRGRFVDARGFEGMRHLDYILRGGAWEGPVAHPLEIAALAYRTLKWFVPVRIVDSVAGLGWSLEQHAGYALPAWVRIAVLAVFGLCTLRCLRVSRQFVLPVLVIFFEAALLLVYFEGGAPRYWLPLNPLMLIVLLGGISPSTASPAPVRGRSRLAPTLGIATACLLAVGGLVLDDLCREPQQGKVWAGFVEICERSRGIAPRDAVVIGHNANAARLISGRHASLGAGDLAALGGGGAPAGRAVYAIVPTARAVAAHGRRSPRLAAWEPRAPGALPGRPVVEAENEYYRLVRLLPEPPHPRGDRGRVGSPNDPTRRMAGPSRPSPAGR
jgi:hypothetical protein